jgi:hypothetical protein
MNGASSPFTDIGSARPLDYAALTSREATHTELTKTIDDLTRSLAAVESGLSLMLDTLHAETIEEEQEDGYLESISQSHSPSALEASEPLRSVNGKAPVMALTG